MGVLEEMHSKTWWNSTEAVLQRMHARAQYRPEDIVSRSNCNSLELRVYWAR